MKIIKKKSIKENVKRAGIWAMFITILFGAVAGSAAYAADQITVANAKALIDDAAKKQLVANKFSDCMGDRKGGEDYNRTYNGADEIAKGKWFNDALLGKTAYAVGPWLESQTQGNFSDGKIWCEENILPMFLNTFGYSITEVACNKFSDSGNGHLSGGIFKTYNDTNCEAMDNVAYYKVQKDDARAYIGQLYDEAVKDNPYAKKWSEDVSYYDPVVGYILYKQDFDTACAASYETDSTNTTVFSKKVKTVNDKGEIEEYYVTPKSGMRDGSSSGKSFVSGGPETCDGLIDKMNSYATNYQEKILEAIKIECASDDVKKKVEEYIKKYEEADSLTADEQKELDKLKKARDSGDYTQATDKGGLECAEFKDITITTPTPTSSTTSGGGETDSESEEEKCYQNAKSLGWVICPVIYGLRDMTENIYSAIEPYLQTNVSIVNQFGDTNSGLYKSWAIFRNIANIVFVILFLFVIFSQLTGYGIDNYGIKRMLPKLILTAIIVNLSFIICAIAVDASNIVGSSIKSFLESIGPDAGLGGNSVSAFNIITQKVVGTIAAIGTGAAILAVGFALEGWAIIIPILLFLLTVVIAIFFALVVLSMRQALIVMLIVLSPLAFACNTLPNTEGVFKKWWSAAKGILMVYPIIGAIIGAGYLTASILMSTDQGFFMVLTAGILMVGPYFLIPSLTKKSIDAVGSLGSKISGVGKGFSGKAKGVVNDAPRVKDFKANQIANRQANSRYNRANGKFSRWLDNKTLESAEKNKGKKGIRAAIARRTIASNGRLRAAQRNNELRVSNSRESVMNSSRAAANERQRMETGGFAAREASIADEALSKAVVDYEKLISGDKYSYIDENGAAQKVNFQNNSEIGAALKAELLKGDAADQSKIRALQNTLNRKGDKGRNEIFSAMAGAQKAAAGGNGSISKDSVKTFSGNIMNNQGDYKGSHRSLYEYAKDTASDGNNASIDSYGSKGIESLTADSFLNTDSTQMQRYLASFRGDQGAPAISADEKQRLSEIAHSIANNTNVHSKIRKDDYGEALKTFAPDVDWDDVFNGNSIKVAHSPAPTPSTPPSQTQAARGAGANAATQSATATAEAARNAQRINRAADNAGQRINSADRTRVDQALKNAENGGGSQTDSGIWLPS